MRVGSTYDVHSPGSVRPTPPRTERPKHWAEPRRPKTSIVDWRDDEKLLQVQTRLAAAESRTDELTHDFEMTKAEAESAPDTVTEARSLHDVGLATNKDLEAAAARLDRATKAHKDASRRLAENTGEIKALRSVLPQVEDAARTKSQVSIRDAYGRAVKRLADCLADAVEADEEVRLLHDAAASMFPGNNLHLEPGRIRIPSSAGLIMARWPRESLTREVYDNWVRERQQEGLLS